MRTTYIVMEANFMHGAARVQFNRSGSVTEEVEGQPKTYIQDGREMKRLDVRIRDHLAMTPPFFGEPRKDVNA